MTPAIATINLNQQSFFVYLIDNQYHIFDINEALIDTSSTLGNQLLTICNQHEATLKA